MLSSIFRSPYWIEVIRLNFYTNTTITNSESSTSFHPVVESKCLVPQFQALLAKRSLMQSKNCMLWYSLLLPFLYPVCVFGNFSVLYASSVYWRILIFLHLILHATWTLYYFCDQNVIWWNFLRQVQWCALNIKIVQC